MGFEIKGLKELQKRMESLSQAVKNIEGQQSVPLAEMLTPNFVMACSRFQSANELFEASGFEIKTEENFKAIPDDKWDDFIRSNTSFSSWKEMLGAAGTAWTKAKLGL